MNSIRKHFITALSVIAVGSTALAAHAQTAPMEGRHGAAMTQEQRAAAMSEHYAKRQAKLHDALQLTGGQESAWAAYQNAIKPTGDMMHRGGDRAAWKTMSAPQRLEKMIAMSEQHTAKMKASVGPLNTFYSVLNPAQKKVFDEQSMGGHHRGGHGGNWRK
ncbi:MAG: Spy/CpxP family protein refolding chaperone [Massilia sp.]